MNITEIRELLAREVATVVFTKRNGDERTMICTTLPQYTPEVQGTSELSEEVVTCFDLEKEDWRSFRVDSVISIDGG